MKITEIETLSVSVGGGYDYAVLIVLVRTDEGLTGIGEASLAGRGRGVLGILDHFAELLVGQDPGRIEHWWSELVRGTFWSTGQVIMSAVAGIDIALWDLKGKRLGVPVYDLLGGPTRERVRVYRHLAGSSAEELVEDALRWREQGFTALRFGPLAAFDDHSLAHWDPQASIVQTIAATESLQRRGRRRRRPDPRRAHDVQPRRRLRTSAMRSSRTACTSTKTRSVRSTPCRCERCATR